MKQGQGFCSSEWEGAKRPLPQILRVLHGGCVAVGRVGAVHLCPLWWASRASRHKAVPVLTLEQRQLVTLHAAVGR